MKFQWTLMFTLTALLAGCLDRGDLGITVDNDLEELIVLINDQPKQILGKTLMKKITTNSDTEFNELRVDSSFFDNEFRVLTAKELRAILMGGGYEKLDSSGLIVYRRKQREKKGPARIAIQKNDRQEIISFSLIQKESNMLYKSKRESNYYFEDERLVRYNINGFQKLFVTEHKTFQVEGQLRH